MEIGDGTRCVHGGHTADGSPGSPLHPGPVLSTTFHLGPPDAALPDYFYGRPGNPTWTALEEAIGALDGGECVSFASGMAAIGAVLRLTARAGSAIVLPSDGYYVTRALAHTELAPLGVEVREVPTPGPWPDRVLDGATLLLVETPSNPGLDVCDIRAAAAAAHAAGALLAVDNTTATPLGQRPLALGADLTVASDTKALAGHGDVLLGHVTAADPALAQRLREARTRGGAVPGPMEAWLAHRGLGTLDLRLSRQAANAEALARAVTGPPRRQRRAVARTARRPVAPGRRRADAPVERGAAVHAALAGGREPVPRRLPLHRVRHQLRRPAQHRGPPGALGRRRRPRPRPLLRRLRGHRRPRRRRRDRPGRRVAARWGRHGPPYE